MSIDFEKIMIVLKEVNMISIIFRITLAMVLGGTLGLERGMKNRPAGFRTYMLVCVGATLVVTTNQYVYQTYGVSDPMRLGAQVVSGIGFLGAGTIIVTKRNQIKGLTTAAGLWAVACLGIALGIGFYSGALVGGFAILLANSVLHTVGDKIRGAGLSIDVYIEFNRTSHISSFLAFLHEHNYEIKDMSINKGQIPGEKNIALIVTIDNPERIHSDRIIDLLSQAEGIEYIEEI